jgi:hypothetical protein
VTYSLAQSSDPYHNFHVVWGLDASPRPNETSLTLLVYFNSIVDLVADLPLKMTIVNNTLSRVSKTEVMLLNILESLGTSKQRYLTSCFFTNHVEQLNILPRVVDPTPRSPPDLPPLARLRQKGASPRVLVAVIGPFVYAYCWLTPCKVSFASDKLSGHGSRLV